MSKVISDILGQDRLKFRHNIESWEKRAGSPSHDLHLYSDMRASAISAVEHLGLDPSDTISGELYFALQERARQDNLRLSDIIGISSADTPDKMLNKITKWVTKNSSNLDVWTLKASVVRTILKKSPPRVVMKSLGLRSVDSMLKRSNVAEILSLADELETSNYRTKLITAIKKVKPSDFDQRKVTFEEVDKKRIERLQKADFNLSKVVLPNYVLGSITIIPPTSRFPLDVLAVTMIISEILAEMRRHSAYYRTLSTRWDFGEQFAKVADMGIHHASRGLSEIGWNSIHKHLVGNEDFFARIEQPYLTIEEFRAEPAVAMLSRIDPAFKYWENLEYTFYHHGSEAPVSLNLIDVVINGANRHPYHLQQSAYGQAKLWEELWARYLTHDQVAEDIIGNFISH